MKKLLCLTHAKERLGTFETKHVYTAICQDKACKDQPPKPCVFVEVKR